MSSVFNLDRSQRQARLDPALQSQLDSPIFSLLDDDIDDFQVPLTQTTVSHSSFCSQGPLNPSRLNHPQPKRPRCSVSSSYLGKENEAPLPFLNSDFEGNSSSVKHKTTRESDDTLSFACDTPLLDKGVCRRDEKCGFDFVPSTIDCGQNEADPEPEDWAEDSVSDGCWACSSEPDDENKWKLKEGYFRNSIESKLLASRRESFNGGHGKSLNANVNNDFKAASELDLLLNFGSELDKVDGSAAVAFPHHERDGLHANSVGGLIQCPLCGIDISDLTDEQQNIHTNDCIDEGESKAQDITLPEDEMGPQLLPKAATSSPVVDWLHNMGLSKYEGVFVKEEVDWDTLQWLTEEDLLSMGITALGPRKKIVHALCELRKGIDSSNEKQDEGLVEPRRIKTQRVKLHNDQSERKVDEISKAAANKLITDYFPGSVTNRKKVTAIPGEQHGIKGNSSDSGRKLKAKRPSTNRKSFDIPSWCCIPGTPFRVDAFKYLRGDCSHWFLTHFHLDHYQGLTKSFNRGKIYCSSITARLVNMNIGIPFEKLHVIPLNEKSNIAGIDVTFLDANHCPGSVIILFQPPSGKAVLHTGDFRFSQEIASSPFLQMCPIHTLILDTTYCNPQYDFPKQEAVTQFVIDAIQAETFNPRTLFLIGSYTIGKERLFLEVARVLRKKVYVNAAKLRLLKCLGFEEEDMQGFTSNEHESNIHVAPMWTLASFKRLKHVSSHYADRFSLIVAFSPTGWTFGKGKKKSPGRRWQQGTIIRYEVPYSEHCSFTELREFVKLVSPDTIIPSVNNEGPESANEMISLLLS
ncbi:uncharacterized protein LOC129318516 [Prosopis cineraria]|uniref:uncharacterized protein LOC129318516 n=1 Tax=Prosopis cineraria TaxID=364024 RepID=UPI00240FE458|nr:uncharacterized protein LOC129318516 [Prosopis cineraria]